MLPKSFLALFCLLVFVACTDSVKSVPRISFRTLCRNWRCVYYQVVEQDHTLQQGGYSNREYFFVGADGGFILLNQDSSYIFTVGLGTDSLWSGKILGYDSLTQRMQVVGRCGNKNGLDSVNLYADNFCWSLGKRDTLLMTFVRKSTLKESRFTYKLLPR